MSKQDFSIRVEAGALDDRGSLARLSEALEDLGAELAFKDGSLVVRRRRPGGLRSVDLPMHCLAYRVSGQMNCYACGLIWDADAPPPACPCDESPRFTQTIRD